MADGLDDINDFSNEEFDDDFDPTIDADIDEDIDLDDIEDDDDDDGGSSSSSSSSSRQKDDYDDSSVEGAVKANPKRQQARKRNITLIEGHISRNELEKEEGQRRAWASLHEKTSSTDPKPYTMDASFQEGDYIVHPKFGNGFVIEMATDTKMSALFEDGMRKLVCNLKK